jgi:hypothetical protein
MAGAGVMLLYQYERGEHRRKHCWRNARADFVPQNGVLVGKCPNTITDIIAETILNQAVAEPDPFAIAGQPPSGWPKRLYGVYKGVIYEAVPTQPGKSYHGYPWRGREGRGPLPREVVEQLRDRARTDRCLEDFEAWLDEYS